MEENIMKFSKLFAVAAVAGSLTATSASAVNFSDLKNEQSAEQTFNDMFLLIYTSSKILGSVSSKLGSFSTWIDQNCADKITPLTSGEFKFKSKEDAIACLQLLKPDLKTNTGQDVPVQAIMKTGLYYMCSSSAFSATCSDGYVQAACTLLACKGMGYSTGQLAGSREVGNCVTGKRSYSQITKGATQPTCENAAQLLNEKL